jgi:hypothetical protein
MTSIRAAAAKKSVSGVNWFTLLVGFGNLYNFGENDARLHVAVQATNVGAKIAQLWHSAGCLRRARS